MKRVVGLVLVLLLVFAGNAFSHGDGKVVDRSATGRGAGMMDNPYPRGMGMGQGVQAGLWLWYGAGNDDGGREGPGWDVGIARPRRA